MGSNTWRDWLTVTGGTGSIRHNAGNGAGCGGAGGLFVCRGPNATPAKEVDFPFIDGWLVRPGWDRIKPKEEEYDWSFIDAELALAARLNKKSPSACWAVRRRRRGCIERGPRPFAYTPDNGSYSATGGAFSTGTGNGQMISVQGLPLSGSNATLSFNCPITSYGAGICVNQMDMRRRVDRHNEH